MGDCDLMVMVIIKFVGNQKVKRVVVLGGAFFVLGNVNPAAEANVSVTCFCPDDPKWIYGDPEAADVVFTSGANITVVGINITTQVKFTGIFLHDPVSFVAVVRPDFFKYKKGVVRVETQGICVGHTLMDQGLKNWNSSNPWTGYSPVEVAWTVNVVGVLDYIKDRLMASHLFFSMLPACHYLQRKDRTLLLHLCGLQLKTEVTTTDDRSKLHPAQIKKYSSYPGEGGARQLVSAVVQQDWRPTKLFVFGDSFAATGNNDNDFLNTPWNYPYGKTFPGKPTGRYSDGRVLTDFIAKFIGVKSPVSYKLRNKVAGDYLKYGMNFAYADTGVTNISYYYPNLTTQIDYFQRIIEGASSVYNTTDLHSSVALVTISGDDYESYIFSMEDQTPAYQLQSWKSFSTSVVNQITISLKRIHDLGVKKILVTALEPMGCRPTSTAVFSYKKCNETRNSLSRSHNLLLKQTVDKLNHQAKSSSSFIILDLYTSFMSALKHKGSTTKFKDGLKPCCAGVTPDYPYGCGTMTDIPGEETYTICESAAAAFFWDYAHPTQQGWFVVYSNLKATLKKLF
ncbi:hypothetical protein ACLB2K_065831 [Fragaria x ananassa]